VQRYFVDEREILYLVTFCLPRFLDQDFDDKFITLFHEMYHIGPAFDGDLRRHPGRCAMHTSSKNSYDKHMAHLALEFQPTPAPSRQRGWRGRAEAQTDSARRGPVSPSASFNIAFPRRICETKAVKGGIGSSFD
jgi:hypothetical protein